MKITGVKTSQYRSRHGRQPDDARRPDGCLVELLTDQEISGIAIGRARVQTDIERLVKEILADRDPRAVSGLWQRMSDHDCRGTQGVIIEAAAVLDNALWDLKARANQEPLWKTLGGSRPRANVYASDAGMPGSDAELSDWYAAMAKDYGLREGKLRVGPDQDADRRRLGLMREALVRHTPEPVLMIDADECWSPKQAVRRIREMEQEYDLTWVQAPVPARDFPGLKHVSNSIRAAVCGGEYLETVADFLPHFHHRSLDVIRLDPSRCGITAALQLADAAYGS